MANTRGGLIVHGVTDSVSFVGITAADANPDQYAQWVRNLVQPYLSDVELRVLSSEPATATLAAPDTIRTARRQSSMRAQAW